MAVVNNENKFLQDGDGVKREFTFGFKIFKDTDLKVYKVDKITGEMGEPLVPNKDYTVVINKVKDGGRVIYAVAPTADEQAGGYRDVAISQPAKIPTDTQYVEKTLENSLDRACMISQQLDEKLQRSIMLPIFSGVNSVEFDTPQDGKATYWEVNEDVATLKNCATNPDDLVDVVTGIKDECEGYKNETETLKNECEDLVNAGLGVLPNAENVSSWARDDVGNVVNLPLEDFKAAKTPFLKAVPSDHKQIKILGPLFIVLELESGLKKFYKQLTDLVIDINACLDAGVIAPGKDYYLYLCFDEVDGWSWKISLNATYPDGNDEYNSRKLGGFHTLCVGVTAANAPRAGHPAIGYNAEDIIPNSVWAYNFKSSSNNAGAAFVDKLREWWDIYNTSGNGVTTGSLYGATRTHTRAYHNFVEDYFTVGKQMASQNGFSCAMEGSNYLTAVKGAVQPNPDTTGGRVDTANKRMTSNYFLEEGCGLQWQHSEGLIGGGGTAWSTPDTAGKGVQYGNGYVGLLGGDWNNGGYTGPRCRDFGDGPSSTSAGIGGRGRSCHIEF